MATALGCLWLQHGGEAGWAMAVADELAKAGIHSSFACFMKEIHDIYLRHGCDSDYFSDIFADEYALPEEEILRLERQYGPPALDSLTASDVYLRLVYGDDPVPKRQFFARALKYWERYFDTRQVRIILCRDRASLLTRSAHQVAATRSEILFVQLGVGPDDHHMALYDMGTQFSWTSLLEYLAEGRDISPARRAELDAFVAQRVPMVKTGLMHLKLQPLTLPGRVAEYLQDWRESHTRAAANPMERGVFLLKRHLRDQRAGWKSQRQGFTYEAPQQEPYVYVPLFHTEESVHLINTRHWCRVLVDLVRHVSESVPADHAVYVKEHPVILGDLTRAAMDELKRIPKVRIIDPRTQSQALIRSAAAVVVTEGTAGWEAFLMRRPLLVVGAEPYYAHSNLVFRVRDMYELEDRLFAAIQAGTDHYRHHEDDWYRFIDAALTSSFPGVIETYEYPHITDTGKSNIVNIARAVLDRFSRHQNCERQSNG
jgi:hypothetical protein